MPSYITVHRTSVPEQLLPLVTIAEALLNRPNANGVTVRNVAVMPRTGRLYVHADAPEPALLADLFGNWSLESISIAEADAIAWGRLIALPSWPDGSATDVYEAEAEAELESACIAAMA